MKALVPKLKDDRTVMLSSSWKAVDIAQLIYPTKLRPQWLNGIEIDWAFAPIQLCPIKQSNEGDVQ